MEAEIIVMTIPVRLVIMVSTFARGSSAIVVFMFDSIPRVGVGIGFMGNEKLA